MKLGELIQLCDVVPAGVWQPAGKWIMKPIILINNLPIDKKLDFFACEVLKHYNML